MNFNNISLLLLRLAISYIWLTAGMSKLLNAEFINNFPHTLTEFAKNSPYNFYSNFLNQSVIPHAYIFAQLTIWGEILTGIAFLFGFPMAIAVFAGILMNLNYYFVAHAAPSQFLNILMVFSQLAAYSTGAGSIWGIEAKFNKKL